MPGTAYPVKDETGGIYQQAVINGVISAGGAVKRLSAQRELSMMKNYLDVTAGRW
jgi:hypothetical protein